jgi:uncharacterized protein
MPVHIEEHVWITLSGGCRLGARLWLPETAVHSPVPAVLEYIPYRKRDGTRARDDPMHGYFAQNGYAAVRVDMRGSGESDGYLADEYLKQEQDDALEVIAWIASQPWCSGAVGLQGKSWGGFNALQIAARRPPALKAIITTFSTDNRYTDDIHYMGGCLLNDNLWWGSIMLAYQSRPLDPEIVGPEWRGRWLERLEKLPFFPALWLSHQRYDDYWKHGSICEDYAAIDCPVLAIGGWSDAYTNAVPRLLTGLKVPRLGIIGPWGHLYPHDGVPGPAIGYLQEAVRWWDQWLKGRDTGIMNEPMLRAYIEDPVIPDGTRTFIPGRWVGEASYPSRNIQPRRLYLRADRSLGEQPDGNTVFSIHSPQSQGKAAGEWMGTGCPGEHPTDQRLDDGGALVFDTLVLEREISGPQSHSPRRSRAPLATRARALLRCERDAQRVRIPVPAGSPHPAVDCDGVLADYLAGAVPGHVVDPHSRECDGAAGAAGDLRTSGVVRAAGPWRQSRPSTPAPYGGSPSRTTSPARRPTSPKVSVAFSVKASGASTTSTSKSPIA